MLWDGELARLRVRDGGLRRGLAKLRREGALDRRAERVELERRRAEAFTSGERSLLESGASDQEYQYLGSAKILSRIGAGFADALCDMLEGGDSDERQ